MLTNYWIWLAIASSILTNIGFKLAAMVTNHPTKKMDDVCCSTYFWIN